MIPLIVIRPQPGADATVAAARMLGLDPRAHPLFEIAPRAWQAPDPDTIDSLLIGSANAVRQAGSDLELYRRKPVYCVGAATAEACRAAGLEVAASGTGGLQAVLDRVEPPARLLRLAGEERVDLAPPTGVSLVERVVYASRPLTVGDELGQVLRSPCLVALHSAAAARHFAGECDRLNIPRQGVGLVTIGPRVSEAVGCGWAAVTEAAAASDEALLACAAKLCQNLSGA